MSQWVDEIGVRIGGPSPVDDSVSVDDSDSGSEDIESELCCSAREAGCGYEGIGALSFSESVDA